MSLYKTNFEKIRFYISKYYYYFLLLLCAIGTLKSFLSLSTETTIYVICIRLTFYCIIMLLPLFLRLFLKSYDQAPSEQLFIVQIVFIICISVILWNSYFAVFAISLSFLYAIFLRKNTPASLVSAAIISIIGVYSSSDFVFTMTLIGVLVLLTGPQTRQMVFLIIDSLFLGIYTITTYESSIVIDSHVLLLAFLASYITIILIARYQNTKKVIISILTILWCVFLLYLYTKIPCTYTSIWLIIPCLLIGHTIRSTSDTPAIEEIAFSKRRSFWLILFIYSIPALYSVLLFILSIKKDTILDYSFGYPLLQYYITWSDLGFVQRGLLGEVIKLIFGFIIPVDKMIIIGLFIHFFSVIVVFLCIIKLFLLSSKNSIPSKLALFVLFGTILYPYLFTFEFRSDLPLAAIALICILLSIYNNASIWLIPLLSITAVLIHPVYGFLIFSPVFITMCFRAFLHHENHKTRNTIILITSTSLVILLFFFFTFFSYRFGKLSIYDGVQLINTRADGWYEEDMWLHYDPETGISNIFTYLLYADPNAHSSIEWPADVLHISHINTIKRLIVLLPLFLYYFYIFLSGSKLYNEPKKRFICRLLPFTILVMVPLYIWEIDYGRWNLHLILSVITAMQLPAIINKNITGNNITKEQRIATYIYLISELSSIITWYA